MDWPDNSPESERMKSLFVKGFSGDIISLKEAFDLGVNVRNSVMAQNIYQILNEENEQGEALCRKSLMFIGGLHLAEDIVMPMAMGRQKYQSIASQPILASYSQVAHEILDCNELGSLSSRENMKQCYQTKAFGWDSAVVENLFVPGDFFEITSVMSFSQTAGIQLSTFPKINYNIMIFPENSN